MDDQSEQLATLSWHHYGERGVLLELPSLEQVHALDRAIRASGLAAECVPGAQTLYVEWLDAAMSANELVRQITLLPMVPAQSKAIRTHTIDVVYDGADLVDVADLTGLSVDEVVARHSAPTYTVAFLGFSRSFPYLAGLDPTLIVSRLASPRTLVPAGSVGMGAGFTGIYPAAAPGGWRLLGHTKATLFDDARDPPSMLANGDRVRFRPIEL